MLIALGKCSALVAGGAQGVGQQPPQGVTIIEHIHPFAGHPAGACHPVGQRGGADIGCGGKRRCAVNRGERKLRSR